MKEPPILSAEEGRGLIRLSSPHSFEHTVGRIEAVLREAGVSIFGVVDHSGEAERAGLSLRPTRLFLFGNPAAGTPVMVAAPTAAIDLPLKALVWQADDGQVWVAYNGPTYLAARHDIPPELVKGIGAAEPLIQMALA
jgi:uncharacterized protein (DUF302 family)